MTPDEARFEEKKARRALVAALKQNPGDAAQKQEIAALISQTLDMAWPGRQVPDSIAQSLVAAAKHVEYELPDEIRSGTKDIDATTVTANTNAMASDTTSRMPQEGKSISIGNDIEVAQQTHLEELERQCKQKNAAAERARQKLAEKRRKVREAEARQEQAIRDAERAKAAQAEEEHLRQMEAKRRKEMETMIERRAAARREEEHRRRAHEAAIENRRHAEEAAAQREVAKIELEAALQAASTMELVTKEEEALEGAMAVQRLIRGESALELLSEAEDRSAKQQAHEDLDNVLRNLQKELGELRLENRKLRSDNQSNLGRAEQLEVTPIHKGDPDPVSESQI